MERIAAHYIYAPPQKVYKLHYVELDENKQLHKISPLEKEVSGTAFFNGILILSKTEIQTDWLLNRLKEDDFPEETTIFDFLNSFNREEIRQQDAVFLYLLDGINLTTTKLRTDNGRCNCHIQRL
jgi:hypothetical protein